MERKDKEFAFAPIVRIGSKVRTNFYDSERHIIREVTDVIMHGYGSTGIGVKMNGGSDGLGKVITGGSWAGREPMGIDQTWIREVVEY